MVYLLLLELCNKFISLGGSDEESQGRLKKVINLLGMEDEISSWGGWPALQICSDVQVLVRDGYVPL